MGSPTSKVQNEGKFVHHTLADGDFKHFMKMHEPVTAARTLLTAFPKFNVVIGSFVFEIN